MLFKSAEIFAMVIFGIVMIIRNKISLKLDRNNLLISNTAILGDLTSLFDFSGDRIRELKQKGYEDAKKHLEQILTKIYHAQKTIEENLINFTQKLLNDEPL